MINDEYNNEVLGQLWNNHIVREKTKIMRDLFPNMVAENEVLTHKKQLIEAGYIGQLPKFLFRFGRFGFWSRPTIYKDYWIRAKTTKKNGEMYSIFKEKK
jgi:hypothetical protein